MMKNKISFVNYFIDDIYIYVLFIFSLRLTAVVIDVRPSFGR